MNTVYYSSTVGIEVVVVVVMFDKSNKHVEKAINCYPCPCFFMYFFCPMGL